MRWTPIVCCYCAQMAVIDGYVMQSQTKRLNIAGRHVTSYLLDLLRRRGCSLDSSADMETVR